MVDDQVAHYRNHNPDLFTAPHAREAEGTSLRSDRRRPGTFRTQNDNYQFTGTNHGVSGRFTYNDDRLGKIIYNMPPMDRRKLSMVIERKGNWVNLYNDLISRYSEDQINAFMHGGEAHYATGVGTVNNFVPFGQHKNGKGIKSDAEGSNGSHALQYHVHAFSGHPSSQGNKRHGILTKIFSSISMPAHSEPFATRRNHDRGLKTHATTGDIVPFVNFWV